jgi:hypothetical protein
VLRAEADQRGHGDQVAEAQEDQAQGDNMTLEEFDKKWYPFIAGAAIVAERSDIPTFMQPGVESLQELCQDWRHMVDREKASRG